MNILSMDHSTLSKLIIPYKGAWNILLLSVTVVIVPFTSVTFLTYYNVGWWRVVCRVDKQSACRDSSHCGTYALEFMQ